jgi:hypothetical protein
MSDWRKKYRRIQPGEVHNKWTIVSKSEKPRHWNCVCECGNTGIIFGPNLTQNKSKSCGCNWKNFIPWNRQSAGDASFNMIYSSYRTRATKKDREFELTEAQFKKLIFEICYYCDSPPDNIRNYKRKGFIFKYNGIDRIDSNLGYISDNCVTCCSKCNYMKNDMGLDSFFEQIDKIYNKHLKED